MRYLIVCGVLFFAASVDAAPKTSPRPPRPGIFEKKASSGFVVDGVKFHSMQEWRDSKQYGNMLMLREVDKALEDFNDIYSYRNMSRNDGFSILKRYNKDRTTYGLYSARQQYITTTKSEMGWNNFPRK